MIRSTWKQATSSSSSSSSASITSATRQWNDLSSILTATSRRSCGRSARPPVVPHQNLFLRRSLHQWAIPVTMINQDRNCNWNPTTKSSTILRCLTTTTTTTTIQSSTILLPSNTFFRSRTFQQQQQQQQHSKETRRSVFIQTENTPNPESLKFVPSGKIVFETDNGTGYFVSKTDPMEDILRSPLAKQLFRVEGIKAVYVRSIISSWSCPVLSVCVSSCWKIGDDAERILARNLSFVGWQEDSG